MTYSHTRKVEETPMEGGGFATTTTEKTRGRGLFDNKALSEMSSVTVSTNASGANYSRKLGVGSFTSETSVEGINAVTGEVTGYLDALRALQ